MFAIPGILALVVFIYVRPQEVFPFLQKLPLLYLFFGLALFGLAVDLRLRVTKPRATPQLPWVVLLWLWAVITVAVQADHHLVAGAIEMAIALTLYLVIAHSVQTFRAFQIVAGTLLGLVLFLAVVGVDQGTGPLGCVELDSGASDLSVGRPDGRACPEGVLQCYQDSPEPGAEYLCEKIGMLQTHSVGSGRVRYRGVLQDPNELALAVSLGLALALAFFDLRRSTRRTLLLGVTLVLVAVCVLFTKSRGGQLVFLTVLGAYFVRRYGWKGVALGVAMVLPVLLLSGGEERADAAASTVERMEAWATGIQMFFSSPLFGVGQGQFVEHHFLTAHNAYILSVAELGFPGMIIWTSILYLSVKIPWTAMRRYGGDPQARVAVAWSMSLLAALLGLYVGSLFLSFCYHYVLWIYLGLAGALYSVIKTHDPEFEVRYGIVDFVVVVIADAALIAALFVYLRLKGF